VVRNKPMLKVPLQFRENPKLGFSSAQLLVCFRANEKLRGYTGPTSVGCPRGQREPTISQKPILTIILDIRFKLLIQLYTLWDVWAAKLSF
jgi:hypothetical protein